uniref:Uncharacterized protein n=1 Tax=Sphenodon punctatus TaxID=8508 RepID=A0A8D0G5M8_SPHPU
KPFFRPTSHSLDLRDLFSRSSVFSRIITSRNKLDTEQMAMIKETFMSTMGPSLTPVSWGSGCPAWALSTRETLTVAVADSAGSPWSFTTITRLCILPSASSKGRVVRISPLYRPTRKGTAGLLGSCSS